MHLYSALMITIFASYSVKVHCNLRLLDKIEEIVYSDAVIERVFRMMRMLIDEV